MCKAYKPTDILSVGTHFLETQTYSQEDVYRIFVILLSFKIIAKILQTASMYTDKRIGWMYE